VRHAAEQAQPDEIEAQARAADVAQLNLEGDQEWFVKVVESVMSSAASRQNSWTSNPAADANATSQNRQKLIKH
jgi:hypothetical protein